MVRVEVGPPDDFDEDDGFDEEDGFDEADGLDEDDELLWACPAGGLEVVVLPPPGGVVASAGALPVPASLPDVLHAVATTPRLASTATAAAPRLGLTFVTGGRGWL